MSILKKIKDSLYITIPILITFLLYSKSLFYGFRAFDENILIEDFYNKKTFSEYIEKYLLIHLKSFTEAQGFTFSGIKNIHVSILGIPTFYIISFLFNAKPFLFHLWSLLLHCLAVFFFCKLCLELTKNKQTALFCGLLWTVHPANVEPVIWATNWAQLLGGVFYFYTLYKIAKIQDTPSLNSKIFVFLITLIQILFTEHTITIPLAIFFLALYQLRNFKSALHISIPSFIVTFVYWIIRTFLIASSVENFSNNGFRDLIERISYLSPSIFFHQLKLVLFPVNLTIDQIDLINFNNQTFYITFIFIYLLLIFSTSNKFKFFSLGFLLYFITLLPFIQIIPLYSLAAERYNYFGSAFIIFGLISTIFSLWGNAKTVYFIFIFIFLISLVLGFGKTSFFRINDWKNSETLFRSTIKTSKSFFKKGIWVYNFAILTKDKEKRAKSIKTSINILNYFIKNYSGPQNLDILIPANLLKTYELNYKSLLAKAHLRIATNYEILRDRDHEFENLLKALELSHKKSRLRASVYKNLGTHYFQENDFKKALDYYDKSSKISQTSELDFARSVCYLKLKDIKNYEKYLRLAARDISPSNVSCLKTYAQFLELVKGDFQGAAKYYKITTLLEDSPEPYYLLATLYLKLNQIDNALNIVNRGLYSHPKNPNLIYLNGVIKINKGDKNTGKEELIKVVNDKNTPDDIKLEACNILIEMFSKEKDQANAKKYKDIRDLIKS